MTKTSTKIISVALAALLAIPAGQLLGPFAEDQAYGYGDTEVPNTEASDVETLEAVAQNDENAPVQEDALETPAASEAPAAPALAIASAIAATATSSDTVSVTQTNASSGLTTTIEYTDPNKIAFGTPVTFHISGAGAIMGEYGYKWNGVYLYTYGKKEKVLDGAALGTSVTIDPDFQFTFYAPGRYEFSFVLYGKTSENNGNPVYGQIMTTSFELVIPDTDSAYPPLETILANLKNECLSTCKTDYEKALWCHDKIMEMCEYDHSFYFCGMEGALARGKGTCEAYHRTYTTLLNSVGVQTGRITGNGHVWTAVRIDGEWCQVDLTWDASSNARHNPSGSNQYELHMYFGVDDAIMTAAHSDHKPNAGYESNTLKNNYFIRSGEVTRWSDAFTADINKNLAQGKTSFTLAIPTSNISSAYYKYIYPVIAYYLTTLTWTTADGAVQLSATYDGASSLNFTATYPGPSDYTVSVSLPSGYAATSLWLDGVEYSEVAQSGTTISVLAPDGNAKTVTMYKYNASNVPTGMYVWKLAFANGRYTATAMPAFQDLLSYNGFAIRVVDPAGLRFKSGISTTQKRQLLGSGISGYKLTEAGSGYMSNAALAKGDPFILGGKNSHLVPTLTTNNGSLKSDSVWETTGGRDIFVSTLIGMPQEYYNTYYSFRSYATVTNGTDTFTLYGPPVSRSIYHVASQLVTQGLVQPGTDAYTYVNGIITYVENNLLKEA